MEDQLIIVFLGVMKEAMSMLQVEKATAATASSSTWGTKRRWRYVNRDREAAHFSLWNDYFDNGCIYPSSYFRRRYRMRKTLFLNLLYTN
jgi:hypothetical protein